MMSIKCLKRSALFACLCILTFAALLGPVRSSLAAQVTLEWGASSATDVAGYKVHYGTQSRVYTSSSDVGKVTRYTITGLQDGATYYFAVTAYNGSRVESDYSNEAISTTCAYSISPSSQSFSGSGGSTTVTVTASAGCAWTASSGAGWVTITSGSSGTGNGSVVLTVAPNTGGSRATGVSIAGKTFSVTQAEKPAVSKYTINAAAGTGGSISPSGTISVDAGADQTFRIAPRSRYRIYSVVVDGKNVGRVSSYTFTNVNANHTIKAYFRRR